MIRFLITLAAFIPLILFRAWVFQCGWEWFVMPMQFTVEHADVLSYINLPSPDLWLIAGCLALVQFAFPGSVADNLTFAEVLEKKGVEEGSTVGSVTRIGVHAVYSLIFLISFSIINLFV